MKILIKFFIPILILLLSYWTISPLLKPGFFPMHDDTQVARVFEMAKALKTGQFPVRWVPDLGYGFGYPIFNFYSPLPYYFGAIFIIIGFDALVATKIMFTLGILAAGFFMYLLTKEFWGEAGGVVSGLFLIYAPYHAVQIYVRGAVGEFWALAFIPLAIWGLYKVLTEAKWRWVLVGGLGYAGVILSHNITATIFTLFLVPIFIIFLYQAFKKKDSSTIYRLISSILLGLDLSAFFWLPALLEAKFVDIGGLIIGTNDFRPHFLCLWQLWNSPWGFGGSAPGCIDGLSFKIGKWHILMAIFSLLPMIWWWTKDKLRSRIILVAGGYLLLAIFMTLEISKPIWEVLQPLVYIQYPWRFLSLIILATSFLSGALIWQLKNRWLKIPVFSFLIFSLLFYNSKYFLPQTYLNVDVNYYTNKEALTWRTSKISDEYLPLSFYRPQKEQDISAALQNWSSQNLEYNFKTNTPVRMLANLVSLATLIFIMGAGIYARKKES